MDNAAGATVAGGGEEQEDSEWKLSCSQRALPDSMQV